MNIEGISPSMAGVQMSGASPVVGGRFDGQLQSTLGDVSSLLGMSPQQLNANLASTGNLSAVASGSGVSEDRLVSTIKQGLQEAGSKLTGTRLDNIAQRIAHHRAMHMRAAAKPLTTFTTSDWGATSPGL